MGYIPSSFLPDFEPYYKKPTIKAKDFPAVYDLRTLGMVTPVKNQGGCGSCWAHATMGAIESHWLKCGLGTYDLSEQNLRTCHGFLIPSCEGGNEQMATAYLSRIDKPILEVNDPYNTDPNAMYNIAYSWSGPSCPCFTNYIKNLCPGTYTVTVTDFNGCTAIASKTIIVSTKNYFDINSFDETEENSYTLSLNEFENQYYRIYPNPVQDKLYVEFYDKIDKIELVNILGKTIYTIYSEAENDKIIINTDNYNSGIYYLLLYKRNNIYRHVINIKNN